ncbi:MAG TPA: radical SAM protein [Terriglobales bacterium]|nr:radical SAM protein [Terriglobales bacterium]
MRILLFNPPGPEGQAYIREGRCEQRLSSFMYRMVPISLPSTAGLLRAEGHQVRILDAISRELRDEDIAAEVQQFDPELLVMTVSTPTFDCDLEQVAKLRRYGKAFVAGIGVHVTATPGETLAQSQLDAVVRGEPEWTVADLAAALQSGRNLDSVAGISYRRADGAIVHNEERPFHADLDDLPPPARDLIREEEYMLPIVDRPYTLVIPSRGCPHHCTYCTAPSYYGKRLRQRTPARVVDEIEAIAKRGVVNDFTMWSDTFTLDRNYVLELCRELQSRDLGIRWMCNSRVDSIDAEMVAAMKASGCIGISFGIESGVQTILDNVRKGTTVAQGRTAVKMVKDAGIQSLGHFILGLPGETPDTIRETIDYAKDIDPDWAQFYCATPLPGTAFHAQAKQAGHLAEAAPWRQFEFNTPLISTPELSSAELNRARVRAYFEFYARPHVVRRVAGQVRPKHLLGLVSQAYTFARTWVVNA